MLNSLLTFVVAWPNGHPCYELPVTTSPIELEFELQSAQRHHCRLLVELDDSLCLDVVEVQPDYVVVRQPDDSRRLVCIAAPRTPPVEHVQAWDEPQLPAVRH